VLTYAEALSSGLRRTLKQAWGASLADTYSSTEAGTLALQCPQAEHYHVQSESVYVELLNSADRPCAIGEVGRVVISVLHNFAMPLLRYELGDFAQWGEPCACGRGLPVLRAIAGRVRNMARDPAGRLFQPGFDEAMDQAGVALRQYQIVQHAPDSLEMTYVMDREITDDERNRLARALAAGMGYGVEASFSRVDAIARSAGAKYEGFVSRIADVH
jgi:phenylacetate-CoA ligase